MPKVSQSWSDSWSVRSCFCRLKTYHVSDKIPHSGVTNLCKTLGRSQVMQDIKLNCTCERKHTVPPCHVTMCDLLLSIYVHQLATRRKIIRPIPRIAMCTELRMFSVWVEHYFCCHSACAMRINTRQIKIGEMSMREITNVVYYMTFEGQFEEKCKTSCSETIQNWRQIWIKYCHTPRKTDWVSRVKSCAKHSANRLQGNTASMTLYKQVDAICEIVLPGLTNTSKDLQSQVLCIFCAYPVHSVHILCISSAFLVPRLHLPRHDFQLQAGHGGHGGCWQSYPSRSHSFSGTWIGRDNAERSVAGMASVCMSR